MIALFSIGTVGADLSALSDLSDCSITSRLAIIAGTSSCHMAVCYGWIYIVHDVLTSLGFKFMYFLKVIFLFLILKFQSSQQAVFVPGVWGPYFSAMLPGLYLNEGGQSSTGQLVCREIICLHAKM